MREGSFDFIDLISVLSLALGYENLLENRQQSAQNDVGAANDAQAQFLLKNIYARFEEQDKALAKIQQKLDVIIDSMNEKERR